MTKIIDAQINCRISKLMHHKWPAQDISAWLNVPLDYVESYIRANTKPSMGAFNLGSKRTPYFEQESQYGSTSLPPYQILFESDEAVGSKIK